ncbi:Fibrillins and related proteins containing Ca2-binding EGF-like domains [Ceraceosorus bombacis]|uniref:Fibrillins and related proteins containing Ca2-binding EGF-like domains n=1 Tax=Ceraceosorus bombacis TaxID=401625 RepID=A0A0P1BPX6_9BASI|nr:Fibrillins and related proteins containing Ca2-binding EGF-like domains [Ceraceosorus bombacis]
MRFISLATLITLSTWLALGSAAPLEGGGAVGDLYARAGSTKSCTKSTQCSSGNFCNRNKCAPLAPVGGGCYKNSGCSAPGVCFNSKCLGNSAKPSGAPCRASTECTSAYCGYSTCRSKAASGASCYKDVGCKSGKCAKGKCAAAAGTTPPSTTPPSTPPAAVPSGSTDLTGFTATSLGSWTANGNATPQQVGSIIYARLMATVAAAAGITRTVPIKRGSTSSLDKRQTSSQLVTVGYAYQVQTYAPGTGTGTCKVVPSLNGVARQTIDLGRTASNAGTGAPFVSATASYTWAAGATAPNADLTSIKIDTVCTGSASATVGITNIYSRVAVTTTPATGARLDDFSTGLGAWRSTGAGTPTAVTDQFGERAIRLTGGNNITRININQGTKPANAASASVSWRFQLVSLSGGASDASCAFIRYANGYISGDVAPILPDRLGQGYTTYTMSFINNPATRMLIPTTTSVSIALTCDAGVTGTVNVKHIDTHWIDADDNLVDGSSYAESDPTPTTPPAVASPPAPVSGQNLVQDPSFESGGSGWSKQLSGNSGAIDFGGATPAHSGSNAAKLSWGNGATRVQISSFISSDEVPLGKAFQFWHYYYIQSYQLLPAAQRPQTEYSSDRVCTITHYLDTTDTADPSREVSYSFASEFTFAGYSRWETGVRPRGAVTLGNLGAPQVTRIELECGRSVGSAVVLFDDVNVQLVSRPTTVGDPTGSAAPNTNIIRGGDFVDQTPWTISGGQVQTDDGITYFTQGPYYADAPLLFQKVALTPGATYRVDFKFRVSSFEAGTGADPYSLFRVRMGAATIQSLKITSADEDWHNVSLAYEHQNTDTASFLAFFLSYERESVPRISQSSIRITNVGLFRTV